MKPKLIVENVSKSYQMYTKQSDKLLDIFLPNKKKSNRNFNALNNVSFEIYEGETVGIIGINGSGKSTLSNLLAEVMPPSSGILTINGETSLIAINAGLNKQLSGLENIELKCLMLGMKKDQIKKLTPQIVDFADLGHFIDQPVKNYSSGMKSRLGFAISAYTDPDILIVDEALSVGDKTFYKKCLNRIDEFKAEGKTIIFISHSLSQMRSISDRVLWLHHGKVREFGAAKEVLDNYDKFIKWFNNLSKQEQKEYKQEKLLEQSIADAPNRRHNKIKKKQKNTLPFFQFGMLFFITCLFGFFMFTNHTPIEFFNNVSGGTLLKENTQSETTHSQTQSEANEQSSGKVIDQSAVIMSSTVELFEDEELENSIQTLDFHTIVDVKEQVNSMYKVEYEGEMGYLLVEDVVLQKDDGQSNQDSTIDIEELIPLLSTNIASSYQFFLEYIGQDYEAAKEKLRGYSEETDINGNNILDFEREGIAYRFNNDGNAAMMIIRDINMDESLISDLQEKALIQSADTMILTTAKYEVLLDQNNQELAFKPIDNQEIE